MVRMSTARFTKSPSLVLMRLVLTEIQRFKDVKINREMYGIRPLSRNAETKDFARLTSHPVRG